MTVKFQTRSAIIAWYKARQELGSRADIAKKFGISKRSVQIIISRWRKRHEALRLELGNKEGK